MKGGLGMGVGVWREVGKMERGGQQLAEDPREVVAGGQVKGHSVSSSNAKKHMQPILCMALTKHWMLQNQNVS